jgi:hypothetical protein
MNFKHFPAEEDFDASLSALLKSNLVSVWESEDLLVGCPILNFSILCRASLQNVLAQEMLVIESIEVRALSLVRELWRIANHVSVCVVPSVIVVAINAFLIVDCVNEYITLRSVFHF